MPSTWRDIISGVAVIAFIGKIVMALRTFGTNDVYAWRRFADGARAFGGGLYAVAGDFNHPPSMLHVLPLIGSLSDASGIPFPFWIRLPAIVADVGILWLVWRILGVRVAERSIGWAVLFLAAAPPLILISGFHGNTDSVMIFFILLAIHLLERGPRRWMAGAAFGLALSVKVVPVILIPLFLFYPKSFRKALEFFAGTVGVIAVFWSPFLWMEPVLIARKVFGYGSLFGIWGISSLIDSGTAAEWSSLVQRAATFSLIALIACGSWWMNRSKQAPSLFSQAGLVFFAFLALTTGFGIQYLAWLTPWVVELGALPTAVLYATSGVFLLVVYNYWSLGFPWYVADSNIVGSWAGHLDFLQLLCWLTVVFVFAVAWKRARTGSIPEFALPFDMPYLNRRAAGSVAVALILLGLFVWGFEKDKDSIPWVNPAVGLHAQTSPF